MSPTVSFFVHNLAGNPVGRALPIARAFERLGYQVEILGFIFGQGHVFEPYRDEIEAKTIHTTKKPLALFQNIRKLARQATGDIVYAFKPLMTTFAPALYAARVVRHRPLLLDVEDEEVYTHTISNGRDLWMKVLRGWRLGTSWKYTRTIQAFRGLVDARTVVSTALQERYGGILLRHGPDDSTFDPTRDFGAKDKLRERWGLPPDRKHAIFVGTPRSHKGLDVIGRALRHPECEEWDFVLVGPDDNEFARALETQLGSRYHCLGPQPYRETPAILSVADAVPIPSKDTEFARAQVPAKLLDAMAMARPIVASAVGDLPDILGHGQRGWLVEPGDPGSLADALKAIATMPREAHSRARAARIWYEENASTTALTEKLEKILTRVMVHSDDR